MPTSTPGKKNSPKLLFIVMRFLMHATGIIFFRLKAHGMDRIPAEGGLLLVSNHASNLDPPFVGCCLRRPLYTLAKAELFKFPIFGWTITNACNAFPIRRGGVDRAALRRCSEFIAGGYIVSLFPEGTRTTDGELQPGKPGAGMIAAQTGARCIAAYIDGAHRAWPRSRWFPLPYRINVYYGEPFDLPKRSEGMPRKDYYQLCSDEMMRHIAALRPTESSSS